MVEIVNLIFSQLDQIPESLAVTPLAAFSHRRLEVRRPHSLGGLARPGWLASWLAG